MWLDTEPSGKSARCYKCGRVLSGKIPRIRHEIKGRFYTSKKCVCVNCCPNRAVVNDYNNIMNNEKYTAIAVSEVL